MESLVSLAKKLWQRREIRFLAVGCFNTVLDFILLNILFGLVGLPQLVSNTISVTIGITISYFLNHKIVFRHNSKPALKNYLRFFVITGFSAILIQNLVIYTVMKVIPVSEEVTVNIVGFTIAAKVLELNIAKVMAVLTGMSWNFLLYKYVVFKNEDEN